MQLGPTFCEENNKKREESLLFLVALLLWLFFFWTGTKQKKNTNNCPYYKYDDNVTWIYVSWKRSYQLASCSLGYADNHKNTRATKMMFGIFRNQPNRETTKIQATREQKKNITKFMMHFRKLMKFRKAKKRCNK